MLGKSNQYMILGISAVAAVMFVGGFFAYPMIEPQNETLTQSLAIGGYGMVQGFHADGTQFYEWEGHNSLSDSAKSAISACISGIADGIGKGCDNFTRQISLTQTGVGPILTDSSPVISMIPAGCTISNPSTCDGWEVRGTIDLSSFSCTPGVDCFIMDGVRTVGEAGLFNTLSFTPQEITPGDIIVVTITFNPS